MHLSRERFELYKAEVELRDIVTREFLYKLPDVTRRRMINLYRKYPIDKVLIMSKLPQFIGDFINTDYQLDEIDLVLTEWLAVLSLEKKITSGEERMFQKAITNLIREYESHV